MQIIVTQLVTDFAVKFFFPIAIEYLKGLASQTTNKLDDQIVNFIESKEEEFKSFVQLKIK